MSVPHTTAVLRMPTRDIGHIQWLIIPPGVGTRRRILGVFHLALAQRAAENAYCSSNSPIHQTPDDKSGGLSSEKKRGDDRHVKRRSPVNIDGRRKAKVAQNDQPVAERYENCNGEDYCGGTPVSPQEEIQDYET